MHLKTALQLSTKYICEIILLICLTVSFCQQIQDNQWKKIIKADGLGYYSYLPAIFIYNDYTFSFTKDIQNKYEKTDFGYGFLNTTPKGKVDKYFVGLSILWLPFFLIAHFLSLLFGFSADGYSKLYQIAVLIATNFYLWLGCKYTRKLILEYPISQNIAAVVLLSIVFGTNLLFYVVGDPSHTHAYSFSMIAVFLYSIHSFFKNGNTKQLYWSAFLLGIIVLIRPSNIVIGLMILFFAGSLKAFRNVLMEFRKKILISVTIFILTLFPQFLLYYLQSGHFFVWSYGEEGFNFNTPQIFNVLFSYRKGLFVYTPLTLLSLAGLIYLFRTNKFQFTIMLIFLLLSTYIISSWQCWTYGCSLGQRAFVDYYSVLGLLISFLWLSLRKNYLKGTFFLIAVLFIFYSSVLEYQYRNSIIDCFEMNKQKFWFAFLKTDKKYEGLACLNGLFSGTDQVNIVNIKASNDKFLSSDRKGDYIRANEHRAWAWETFNIIKLSGNKIAIKNDEGKYISAWLDNDNSLMHKVTEIKAWEEFELIPLGENKILLKACNNKFVTLKDEKLSANSDCFSPAAVFTLIKE